nr:hypothetical protein [Helcococcus sueciensis]
MGRKIKIVQFGCGKMAKYLMRYCLEKGGEIVGAFDNNPDIVGKDIGFVIESEDKGIKIQAADEIEKCLENEKPDVCIVATRSTVEEISDIYRLCAKHRVNAISTCEEALYPWNSSKELTEELDKLAKENNCTFSGSGYPDMYWGVLVDTVAGSLFNIKKIHGISSYNVEDYGIALAEGHGAGLNQEDFNEKFGQYNDLNYEETLKAIEEGKVIPSYMWNQNGWLCEKLGLTIVSQTQKSIPVTHQEDLESATLNMTVKAGDATGTEFVVTTETEEGITIETHNLGYVYSPEDFDINRWTFEGEPDTKLVMDNPDTVRLTCSNLVNRIPALIKAEPGYITTDKMPNPRYMVKDMDFYI